MEIKSSFSWGCPVCQQGSTIRAEVEMTPSEALSIISHKHYTASPSCQGWDKILTINLGGCPYFGPEPGAVAPAPVDTNEKRVPLRFRR